MKEQRDQQIAELKTLAEQSGETAQHGFEKKVSTSLYLLIILVRCFGENKENCTHNLNLILAVVLVLKSNKRSLLTA